MHMSKAERVSSDAFACLVRCSLNFWCFSGFHYGVSARHHSGNDRAAEAEGADTQPDGCDRLTQWAFEMRVRGLAGAAWC